MSELTPIEQQTIDRLRGQAGLHLDEPTALADATVRIREVLAAASFTTAQAIDAAATALARYHGRGITADSTEPLIRDVLSEAVSRQHTRGVDPAEHPNE